MTPVQLLHPRPMFSLILDNQLLQLLLQICPVYNLLTQAQLLVQTLFVSHLDCCSFDLAEQSEKNCTIDVKVKSNIYLGLFFITVIKICNILFAGCTVWNCSPWVFLFILYCSPLLISKNYFWTILK